jgi:hypothetical protein
LKLSPATGVAGGGRTASPAASIAPSTGGPAGGTGTGVVPVSGVPGAAGTVATGSVATCDGEPSGGASADCGTTSRACDRLRHSSRTLACLTPSKYSSSIWCARPAVRFMVPERSRVECIVKSSMTGLPSTYSRTPSSERVMNV